MLTNVVFGVVVLLNLFPQIIPQNNPGLPYFQVSIQRARMERALLLHDHVCSGALISAIWVLTTAICMQNNGDYRRLSIHLSSLSVKGGLRLKISRMERHPQFDPETLTYNVAALELEKTLAFGPNISTVRLPYTRDIRGQDCSVAGWKSHLTYKLKSEMFRSSLRIVDRRNMQHQCKPLYIVGQLVDYNLDHILCAKYLNDYDFPAEEGNPMICQYILWGLLTEGSNKAGGGFMIFSKVETIIDWLVTFM